jgi:hypothetical protein
MKWTNYNTIVTELHEKFLPNVNYLASDEEFKKPHYQKYLKMKYQCELFSNGYLRIDTLNKRLTQILKQPINIIYENNSTTIKH